jgi:hypothetical protein
MKIRKGFISNSSSTSFVIDYWTEDKKKRKSKRKSISEVRKTLDRIVRAYNIINQTRAQKIRMFKIGYVTDEIIKARCDYEREYDYNKKGDWVRMPLSAQQRKQIQSQKGKIIINSVKDNSIPYQIQEIIEMVFSHFERWHWG